MQRTEQADTHPQRARWTWLAALGLLLAALGPLLMLLAGIAWGLEIGDELPFFIITAAVALLGAFLVWRFGAWAKLLGIVAAVLVGMALFWTAFGLATPSSFFDFIPGVLVIPGALLAVVASISAIVALRRGHLTTAPAGGEARGIRITLTVVVLLVLLSGVLTFASRSTVRNAAAAEATVRMKEYEFGEALYEVAGGSRVLVRNDDPFLHTFTIEALGIDEALTPGSQRLIEIPDEPGSYILFCRPHTGEPEEPADDDMAAVFVVE